MGRPRVAEGKVQMTDARTAAMEFLTRPVGLPQVGAYLATKEGK